MFPIQGYGVGQTVESDELNVLTTIGDIITHNGSVHVRLASGGAAAGGKVLTVQADGSVAWKAVPGGSAETLSQTLAAGAVMDASITLDATNSHSLGSGTAALKELFGRAVTADDPTSGAGIDMTLTASDAFASSGAAGGNVIAVLGLGDGAGASGKLIARLSGGIAGSDETQVWHDGSNGFVASGSGDLRLQAGGSGMWFSTAGGIRFIADTTSLYSNGDASFDLGYGGSRWGTLYIQDIRGKTGGGDTVSIKDSSGTAVVAVNDTGLGFFGGAPVGQKTLAAYSADDESSAYSGNAGGVATVSAAADVANVADLNALRVAYENLRAMVEDLRTKVVDSTLMTAA